MTGWYTHGLPNGRALRVRISELATPADFRAAVEEFFEGLSESRPIAEAPEPLVVPRRPGIPANVRPAGNVRAPAFRFGSRDDARTLLESDR